MNESSPQSSSITFVSRHAPYGTDNARICLDLVLAGSVFAQDVSYLFLGDGVYQLLVDQRPESVDSKNLAASLAALDVYGVEKVYVDEPSLAERALSVDDLAIPVTVLNAKEVRTLVRDSDQVFNL